MSPEFATNGSEDVHFVPSVDQLQCLDQARVLCEKTANRMCTRSTSRGWIPLSVAQVNI
jgi:hypothetical protein